MMDFIAQALIVAPFMAMVGYSISLRRKPRYRFPATRRGFWRWIASRMAEAHRTGQ